MAIDYTSLLKTVPMFASLKHADCADLAGVIRVNRYRKGAIIFHQDDPGSTLYVIISGQVKITINSPED